MSERKSGKRPPPTAQQLTMTPATIEAGGKTYRLGFPINDARGRLEELVRAHVVRAAIQDKRNIGGRDGDEHYASVKAQVDAGHYRTFGDGWRAVLGSADGSPLFLLALLQEYHPEMTAAEASALAHAEPEQTAAALEVVAPDFFTALLVQAGAPEVKARAAAAGIAKEFAAAVVKMRERGSGSPS